MELLAEEIAKLLGISVEAAISAYPMLRDQYVLFQVAATIRTVLLFLMCVFVVAACITGSQLMENVGYKDDIDSQFSDYRRYAQNYLSAMKTFKVCAISLAAVTFVFFGLRVVQYLVAPDLTMLMELVR